MFPFLRTLRVLPHGKHVIEVALHRPEKLNAMSAEMFQEIGTTFSLLHESPACRAIVLTAGSSRAFTSGLDLADHAPLLSAGLPVPPPAPPSADPARSAARLRRTIEHYQAALDSLSRCRAPVIAAIHGSCIGGGVDLICAADVRIASNCAIFSVKEAALGLCPDIGTLQRLPKLVGSDSWAREVCLTARDVTAAEAHARGLLSALHPTPEAAREAALSMAGRIAALSPVAVIGTKAGMNFARDHSVSSGLAFQAAWSGGALLTGDIAASVAARSGGAVFADVP